MRDLYSVAGEGCQHKLLYISLKIISAALSATARRRVRLAVASILSYVLSPKKIRLGDAHLVFGVGVTASQWRANVSADS
jgi:hypothetical protein